MASCTERGMRNLSRSALVALLRVLMIGILLCRFRGRSFFSSRFLTAAFFLLARRLLSLLNGRLQGLVVQAVRPEDKTPGHEDLGLEPRPQSLFCGHAVVGEKAAGSERSCSQNADPAYALSAYQRVKPKIKPDCGTQRQQRAGELPGREPEENGLPIFPDLLWNFYFDTDSSFLLQSHQFLDDSVAHAHCSNQH